MSSGPQRRRSGSGPTSGSGPDERQALPDAAETVAGAGCPAGVETFETSLSELQQIVSRLEDGALPLEDSMRQFERGVALLRNCYAVLERAEQRIEVLTRIGADGSVETAPFDATATIDRENGSEADRGRPAETAVEGARNSLGEKRQPPRADEALF